MKKHGVSLSLSMVVLRAIFYKSKTATVQSDVQKTLVVTVIIPTSQDFEGFGMIQAANSANSTALDSTVKLERVSTTATEITAIVLDSCSIQEKKALKDDNPGHGMIFALFVGKRLLIIQYAQGDVQHKPQLYAIDNTGEKLIPGQDLIHND